MLDPEPSAARHREAAANHEQAAERHEQSARLWAERGDDARAALERRNVEIELAAAQLERDRADLVERHKPE